MSAIGKPGPSAARPPSTRRAAQGAGGSARGAEQMPTCDSTVAASRRHPNGEFVCRRLGAVTHPGGARAAEPQVVAALLTVTPCARFHPA